MKKKKKKKKKNNILSRVIYYICIISTNNKFTQKLDILRNNYSNLLSTKSLKKNGLLREWELEKISPKLAHSYENRSFYSLYVFYLHKILYTVVAQQIFFLILLSQTFNLSRVYHFFFFIELETGETITFIAYQIRRILFFVTLYRTFSLRIEVLSN